jgi:hypothetical protein
MAIAITVVSMAVINQEPYLGGNHLAAGVVAPFRLQIPDLASKRIGLPEGSGLSGTTL